MGTVLKYGTLTVSLPVDFSENKIKKTQLSPELALQKIKGWCAYQERSQQETRYKLFEYGLNSETVEHIIATLIEENYLNEERFAMALASGKFRIKRWGRIKIRLELKKHKVPEYLINKALNSISPEEYTSAVKRLVEKKLAAIKTGERRKNFYTVLNYALSRGFEGDLVTEQLTQLVEKKHV
jgi:regulatory protein